MSRQVTLNKLRNMTIMMRPLPYPTGSGNNCQGARRGGTHD